MADAATTTARRRNRPAHKPVPSDPTLNLLLVLGDVSALNDPTGDRPPIDSDPFDAVFSVDPDGLLTARSLKSTSARPVTMTVRDLRQRQVKMSKAWTVELTAEGDDTLDGLDVHTVAADANTAIAIAMHVAHRQAPGRAWEVAAVRRDGPVGALL